MSDNGSPDYKALFQREAELRRQAEAQTQPTTFREFIQACHDLLSRPFKVGTPRKSTKGKIPPPTGKYCPTRLRLWSDCPLQQQEIYNAVNIYLQERDAPRVFAPLAELHGLHRRFSLREVRSEKDLERYEGLAAEDHVRDIIAELCKIPGAQERLQLGDGIMFDNHANTLEEPEDYNDDDDDETVDTSSTQHPKPDQFCIHRVDGTTNTLLTTVKYKPPHKLRVKDVRSGLQSMKF